MSNFRQIPALLLALVIMATPAAIRLFAAPLPVEREWADLIAPLLDRHCFKCHGGVRQRGDLDLRSLENILKGGESGPALIPGEPDQSRLLQFLESDSDPHMPPKKQVPATDIQLLKDWIAKL